MTAKPPPRERPAIPEAQLPIGTAKASMFFDRYPRFGQRGKRKLIKNLRHEAIVGQHRDVFGGARVLDLACSAGSWTFAALDAGAAHVIGIESREQKVVDARERLAHYGIDAGRYQLHVGDLFEELARIKPQVDVVFCLGFLYHTLRYPELFQHIAATGAETVIIDTEVDTAKEPYVRVMAEKVGFTGNASPDRYSPGELVLSGRPSLAAIEKMLSVYGFAIERRSDWAAILRDNGPSAADVGRYARGERVTLVCRRADQLTWRGGKSRN